MSITNQNPVGDSAQMVAFEAIEALISRHIDPNPAGLGPANARLRESEISVWLLVACMDQFGENLEDLAEDYEISEDAAMAALYFYWRHREAIDKRISHGRAAFAA